jgi:RNA polymerase sigma-70 factor (ECF subfamily)
LKPNIIQQDFIQLIGKHEKIICKICYLYTNNKADWQDLYQEIVLQAWRGYSNFSGKSKFSTWLYQVALNTAITGFKKELLSKKIIQPWDIMSVQLSEPEQDLHHNEQKQEMYEAIHQLNDIDKAVVSLYLDEASYEEMELVLGISAETLRVKMVRIKNKLKTITKNF